MLFRTLHRLGIPSDVFYVASLGSIIGSVAAWGIRKDKRSANAERLGIFIGLWAPTFMLIGHALHTLETARGTASPAVRQADQNAQDAAAGLREDAEAAMRA
jgi:predicted acylesterase/phospholipase RssA